MNAGILRTVSISGLVALPTAMPVPTDDAMSVLNSTEARVIGVMLSNLANETKRNADAVVAINETLHILTRLEQAQGNVLDKLREGSIRMTDHEKRLQNIENRMPGLLEMRRWVVLGILGGLGMMGTALVKLVILDVPRIPQYVVQQPAGAVVPAAPSAK